MIIFEVDSNENIGLGHITRCLTIADHISNSSICFLTRSEECQKIINNKYKCILVEGEYTNLTISSNIYDKLSKEDDLKLCIVDSYYITNDFFNSIKEYVPVMYIDDLNKQRWDVDYLVNNNLSANYRDYNNYYENTNTELLLGTEYLVLRDEFFKYRPKSIKREIKNLLVSTGGTDSKAITISVINTILKNYGQNINIHVLVGRFNQSLNKLKEIANNNSNVYLYYNASNVAEIMSKNDIAIAAAGNTLYELAKLGIPTITYTIADNQILGAFAFHNEKVMYSIGEFNDRFGFNLINAFEELKQNYDLRVMLQKNEFKMTKYSNVKLISKINIITGDDK